MEEGLRAKTIKGTIWSAVQKFSVMGISFVANILLARMLTPDDFGCVAMLAIFLVISDTFMDSGLGSAIIQKKNLSNGDASTVFYFNFGVAIVLYIILFVCAPFISGFYRTPILTLLLRIQSLVLIINSFSVVQRNLLRKKLEFRKLANANIMASIMSLAVAISMAWVGCGIWSLVGQQLTISLICSIMLWYQSDWRPHAEFNKASFKRLFSFGSFIFLSNLINNIGNNIQSLIIGRAFNAGILGYYIQAKKLEEIGSTTISSIIDQVSYPAMSARQDDHSKLVEVMRKIVKMIAFMSIPLMVLLSILGKPIILLCFGDKWMQSIPYFQILCFAGIAVCLQGVSYYAVAAIGKSKAIFLWTIIKRGVSLGLLIAGVVVWGMTGLLIAIVLGTHFVLLCNLWQVQHYLKYTLCQQFLDVLPYIIITAATAVVTVLMGYIMPENVYLKGILQAIVYIAIYFVVSIIFRLDIISEIKQIVTDLAHKQAQ